MARRDLVTVLAVGVVCLLSCLVIACGGSKAVASQPSFSPKADPTRLVSESYFSLLRGQPMHVLVHLAQPHRLAIFVNGADHPIASCSLWHRAAADGTGVTPARVTLRGGDPLRNAGPKGPVDFWFGSSPLAAGYYDLNLSGRGRVTTLVVITRQ
jgi:hypothetical protein